MGTLPGDNVSMSNDGVRTATIHHFFTAASWIEGAATIQLEQVARLASMQAVAAFPDLHPGKYGPVGIVARADRLYPQLIGNDIGCGMALFALDMPLRKLSLDKAIEQFRQIETIDRPDLGERLEDQGIPADCHPNALGSLGGGNHFCELQAVHGLIGADTNATIDRQSLYLLVHSGSRGLGALIFDDTIKRAGSLSEGLDAGDVAGAAWLAAHDRAVAWAKLNRRIIAERAAACLRADLRLVVDVPHNIVRRDGGAFVHHKGSAAVTVGALAPIAGSRATLSYLVEALPATDLSLGGISHGAGRKYDRQAMHGRVGLNRSEREALAGNPFGGRVICDDRALLIEEAATAYKNAATVVDDLVHFGLVRPIASMKPLITYKSAGGSAEVKRKDERRIRERRRDQNRERRPRHD
ncbi:MAG: hypothetical protein RLZZ444_1827 [Pseudomonadota bacterium]